MNSSKQPSLNCGGASGGVDARKSKQRRVGLEFKIIECTRLLLMGLAGSGPLPGRVQIAYHGDLSAFEFSLRRKDDALVYDTGTR